MRILIVLTILAAILLSASALPVSTPFLFFTLKGLPECARTCKNIHNSAINCLPPMTPVSNEATYISCFCQSQLLHGVKDNTSIYPQECGEEDEKEIQNTSNDLCGIPGPSATRYLSVPAPMSAPTSTSAPSTSTSIPLTTSTLTPAPTQTSVPPAAEPQSEPEHHESWAHKHAVIISMCILGPTIGVVAWLLCCRWYPALDRWYHNHKPRTRFCQRDPAHKELLLANHRRWLDNFRRRTPMKIVDNSRTARLWRWLKREKICPRDGEHTIELQDMNTTLQAIFGVRYNTRKGKFVVDRGSRIPRFKSRRTRFTHDQWIRTNESFTHYRPSRTGRWIQTARRPPSSQADASSVGQPSAYSPLDTTWRTMVPQLPVRPSTPQNPRTPQSPNPSATLSPTVCVITTPNVPPRAFARVSNSSGASGGWRSFSSLQSPTPPSMDMTLLLPSQSLGDRVHDLESLVDEIAEEISSQIAEWKTPRLRRRQ